MSDPVTVTDFQRSFLTFTLDINITKPKTISQPPPFTLNNSRFPLEGRCRIAKAGSTSSSIDYVLSAACKTEQVNVREDIWHDPNADMCLAASTEEFLILKSWERNNRGVMLSPPSLGPQPERHAGKVKDAFTRLRIDIVPCIARLLQTTQDIVDAVLQNKPLVSQTEYSLPNGDRVWLEYPVKVVNASEREIFYQVDTGPVLIPDVSAFDGQHQISMLRQAYMAHNSLNCTELLINVPTPVGNGLSVNHYSKVEKLSATNRMYATD